jgi:hypothetical protein
VYRRDAERFDLVHAALVPAHLALEAPVCVPIPGHQQWDQLGRARQGEGNRAWSAGAGSGVLATGLAQSAWILAEVAHALPDLQVTTQVERWRSADALVLLAEALVSGAGKPLAGPEGQHRADARAAAQALYDRLNGRTL